jgi:hypothetical protein
MINNLTNFTCVEDQEAYDAYCLYLMGVLEELIREVDVQHSDIRQQHSDIRQQHSDIRQQHSDIRQQHSDMDSLINVLKEIVKMTEELKGLFSPIDLNEAITEEELIDEMMVINDQKYEV